MQLERAGFYPAGGGRGTVDIEPVEALERIELLSAGEVTSRRATCVVRNLSASIAERELSVVREKLGWGTR